MVGVVGRYVVGVERKLVVQQRLVGRRGRHRQLAVPALLLARRYTQTRSQQRRDSGALDKYPSRVLPPVFPPFLPFPFPPSLLAA